MTHWWQKILFRYNLLCNSCNWEFVGFAVPGTVSAPKRKSFAARNAKSEAKFSDQQRDYEDSANGAESFESENKNSRDSVGIKQKF